MIKIRAGFLLAAEGNTIILDKLNEELDKFINHPYKNVLLKYDIQNRLGKAVMKEIMNIAEFRNRLIAESEGENADNANKEIMELLNSEITLDAGPVPLSKLEGEDCSGFNLNLLDKFIADDRG